MSPDIASSPGTLVVVDPGQRVPETDCYNRIAAVYAGPTSYHLPAIAGTSSLARDQADHVRGIIILGSGASAAEPPAWQAPLEQWLRPHLDRAVPTLGICYGHQLLGAMFGGELGLAAESGEKFQGLRPIEVDACGPFSGGQGSVVVSHREAVTGLPSGWRSFARSEVLAIEAMAADQLPIYCFQSHPEATQDFLHNQSITASDPSPAFRFGQGIVDEFLKLVQQG